MKRLVAVIIVGLLMACLLAPMEATAAEEVHDKGDFDLDTFLSEQTWLELGEVITTVKTALSMKSHIEEQASKLENLAELNPKQFLSVAVNAFAKEWFKDKNMQLWIDVMDGGFKFKYQTDTWDISVGNKGQFVEFEKRYSAVYPGTFDPVKKVLANEWVAKYGNGNWTMDDLLTDALTEMAQQMTMRKAKNVSELATAASARTNAKDNGEPKAALSEGDEEKKHQATLDTIKAELQQINTSLELQNAMVAAFLENEATDDALVLNARGSSYALTPHMLNAISADRRAETASTASLTIGY